LPAIAKVSHKVSLLGSTTSIVHGMGEELLHRTMNGGTNCWLQINRLSLRK
jgi:hypothetical protein